MYMTYTYILCILIYDDFMDIYLHMYVTNTYDKFYIYVIINESFYNMARYKNILLIFTSMYVINKYVQY